MSPEASLATGRLDGNSLKGIAFLHFLPDNFLARESWIFDEPRPNLPVVFSSLRYSRLPAVNLNNESTCKFPFVPVFAWDQILPIMTVNPMFEVKDRLVFNFDALDTLRCTSPMRTRAGGWRRVNPMCFPVQ